MPPKRLIFVGVVTAVLIAATFTALYTHGGAKSPDSRVQNANGRPVSEKEPPRKGRAMVKILPAEVEGVELKNGLVRAKPGFKFEKQDNGTFAVARMSGGLNESGGGWSCTCDEGKGSCYGTIYTDGHLGCSTDPGGCTKCKLNVTVNKKKTGIMIF